MIELNAIILLSRNAGAVRKGAASLPAPPLLAREQDPRARWLLARSLAAWPDEAVADALLEALGDAYLAVREEAWLALSALVAGLEPLRAEAWIAGRRLALAPNAQSGLLLLRLSALAELAGDASEAERLLDRLLGEQDPPELFALRRVHALAVARGDASKAASLASRFSDVAADFSRRRREAWGQAGAELRGSGQGFLVLRQLEGLARLWSAVLGPYQAGADPRAATLGPWLERSSSGLAELRRWLADEEDRWARAHPGYRTGQAPAEAQPEAADQDAERTLARALVALAIAGGPRAAPTMVAAACCAPRPWLRLLSAALQAAAELSGLAAGPTLSP
ncbi:MAG TPA: HEAT repeat domain-containing protein [Myxococcota bacterium]|nr:HEAT repeat domain-containing protein [Myxococcota bacterium]